MKKCTRKWKLKGYFLVVIGVTFLGVETAADATDMFDGLFMTEVYASEAEIGTANITIDVADWESGQDRHHTSSNGVDIYVHWNAESAASVFVDNGNGYTETDLYDGSSQTGSARAHINMNYITVNYNVVDSSATEATEDTTTAATTISIILIAVMIIFIIAATIFIACLIHTAVTLQLVKVYCLQSIISHTTL